MLQHSYNSAYAPAYPAYPSGLLILSRFTNARYARLDVPDWEFRARPGQSLRTDPSGVISRGRSCVRIKTRVGKNPGARLVEKFIIRERGGAQGFGCGQIGLASDRGKAASGETGRGARGCSASDVPEDRPQTRSRAQRAEPQSPSTRSSKKENPQFSSSAVRSIQVESPKLDVTHPKTPTLSVPANFVSTYSSKPEEIRENPGFLSDAQHNKLKSSDLGSEHLRSPTPQAEPPKSATAETEETSNEEQNPPVSCNSVQNHLLESLAVDRKGITLSRQIDPPESRSPEPAESTNEQENLLLSFNVPPNKKIQQSQDCLTTDEDNKSTDSSTSPKATKKKLAKSKKNDLLKKREPDKGCRTDCVTGDCEDIVKDDRAVKCDDKADDKGKVVGEKLPSFTAQVPDGVKKVKPLKVENKVLCQISEGNVNGVSEAKVEGSALNAKCVAKTKSRAGSTIGDKGDRGNQTSTLESLNTGNDEGVKQGVDTSKTPKSSAEKSSVGTELDDGVSNVNQVPVAEQRVPFNNKVESFTSISKAEGKCESQQDNQVNAPKVLPVSAEACSSRVKPADRAIDVNRYAGAQQDDSETSSLKKNSAFTCVKQELNYRGRKTVEPLKNSTKPVPEFQNRSTTAGSEIKNTAEDACGLKRLQNSERLDHESSDSAELKEVKGQDIRKYINNCANCDVVDGCEVKDVNLNQVVSEEDKPNPSLKVLNQKGGTSLTGVLKEKGSKAVGSEEKRGKRQNIISNSVPCAVEKGCEQNKIVGSVGAAQNSNTGGDSNKNQLKFKKTLPENSSSGVSSDDAAEKAVSKDKKVKKVIKKKSNKENNCSGSNNSEVLSLRSLDELKELFEEYKVVSDVQNVVEAGWELLEVIVDMEGDKKKKKVIVKKKGSRVKVTPLEAKPPTNPAETASPGDILRQLSKKRVSLADEDLNLVEFNPDKRMSITDEVLVEEAALLDKMIKKEMKDARKSSLAFPPISEETADKEVEDLAKKTSRKEKTPSPKRVVPSPQERRELWKKNALRKSLKSLGGFFKKSHHPQTPSSSSESEECDVNCHQKCMELMPNLCGVNQKLMVEALLNLKRGRRSASGPRSRPSLFKMDSESEGSQGEGRVTPPAPPAKTLPRFRTYTITDFQFLKVLGKGSFGKVLLAELKGSECYYAIKCLKKDVVLEDDDVECTMIERKVLALGTGHPYFCHLFCTFQTESHLFFVMEYLNGGDLMFHIQQSGRFDEGRARFYAAEIVSALAFLHKLGIVYRDLKLDNVLLDFDGHIRIADFGMCKLQIYLDKTTDTFCGTPDYMAPEILKGLKYNQCVDWWSFGILLYEMLVGQSPFSGCDEDHLFWSICNERPHMPRHLSQPAVAVLKDLLEKDWTKRLGSSEFGSMDVMNHSFFDGMKWHLLERRQIDPPYKPTTNHPLDTKYFDKAFTSERPTLTPVDKAILETMDQTQFEGFSYTNPNATE